MKVPLLDLKAQLKTIDADLKRAVNDVIDSTQYIMGPKVQELEGKIAQYVGTQFAVGVSSGTDALLASLMALNVASADIVITTPYSFFATAGVIARLNAKPVFVDIDPDTYNMCPKALAEWFQKHSAEAKKVKAIIPVHLYGQCADMDRILNVARAHGIPVIEDAAQAIGAQYPSGEGVKKAGAMGTVGCFSFFPSKNLGGIGDGGIITTNDESLAKKLMRLRNHGAEPKYYHSIIGGNFRLDPIQAVVVSVKLKYLEQWHEARRANAEYYNQRFAGCDAIVTPFVEPHNRMIYNQYVIRIRGDKGASRDQVEAHLNERKIGNAIYYPVPLHLQQCFADLRYKEGDLPHSELAAKEVLAIPVYPELTAEQKDEVASAILDAVRK